MNGVPDSDAGMIFRDGQIIAGKYEVDRVLGQGGMGIVVSAHHIALRQKVAIKLMLPSAMEIPGATERFLREARSAVAIQSEHVARVLDVGTLDEGPPFMVMEYLTGSDLGEVLRREGRLPIIDAVEYVLQACEAIAEAHSLGIVHRDLKPDNVFLTRRADGSALIKVLDFGLSKPTKEDASAGRTPSLTATNMVAGSPQYMSPEQVRGLKNADLRTDVWALGVILYELITGQRPFEADTVAGIFAKIAADAPLSPRTFRPELPPALEATILCCLEKDLSLRVQDVAELARHLAPFGPAEARTSVERIQRLAGARTPVSGGSGAAPSTGASPGPSAPRAHPHAHSLEADIPTLAGPGAIASAPASDPRSPANQPPPAPRTRVAAAGNDASSGPVARHRTRALDPTPDINLELGTPAMHPAERGRPPLGRAPRDFPERGSGAGVGDLRLGGPIRLLVVAIAIAAIDMVLVRTLGHPLSVGPVRPLWIASPLALAGAVWLVLRLTSR